jgi:hypothetical protein
MQSVRRGALTVAYYENPVKDTTQIKWGPVPGVAIGCGHLKVNISAVLSTSARAPRPCQSFPSEL